MIRTQTTRFFAVALGALALLGITKAAHADMLFHNITNRPLYFDISCSGVGMEELRLAPYGTRSLVCTNGSSVASVRIRTREADGSSAVVRGHVYDGSSYDLGYDRDGDVSIARRS